MTADELTSEYRRLSSLLDRGVTALTRQAQAHAELDAEFRSRWAQAILASEGTVAEREAHAEVECSDLRLRLNIAAGMERVAREAVRSRQTQLTGVMAVARAHQEEARLAGRGPQ